MHARKSRRLFYTYYCSFGGVLYVCEFRFLKFDGVMMHCILDHYHQLFIPSCRRTKKLCVSSRSSNDRDAGP